MPNKRKGKWLAYDALEGYKEGLKEIDAEYERASKPILSENQLIEINNILLEAYQNKSKVKITTFYDGKIIIKEGLIIKIDLINKIIHLGKDKLTLNMIINITII